MIRLGMMSPANSLVIPLQDAMGLDHRSRVNIPSTPSGNWRCRFAWNQLNPGIRQMIRSMNERYGRLPQAL